MPPVAIACLLCLLSQAAPDALPSSIATDLVGDGTFTAGIEGPAAGPDGALYVVNLGNDGTIGRVWPRRDGAVAEVFVVLPRGSIANGLRFHEGVLYAADYTGHNILRIDAHGDVAVHAHDPRMHQPNDLALAGDGTLYASDPRWSHGDGQLWRIDRDGSTHLLERGMGTTNGIELSPDGRRLYVNESLQRRIWVYDVDAAGGLSNKRMLIAFHDHGLDGMRTDVAGNLYVARHGAGTVAIVSPQGALLGEVRLKGARPTNIAFGGADGRDVFVTLQDRGAIEVFRSAIPGRETGQPRRAASGTLAGPGGHRDLPVPGQGAAAR